MQDTYIQRYEPNKAGLIDRINRLKGSRTSAEFTKIVNEKYSAEHGENILSAPTFSRILNGSFKGSLSTKLMFAMIEAAETKLEDYEIDALFRANGMERLEDVKAEDDERDREHKRNMYSRINSDNVVRNRILEFDKDKNPVPYREVSPHLGKFNNIPMARVHFDTVIRLDDAHKDYWAFNLCPYSTDSNDMFMFMRRWGERSMTAFLIDHWNPEKLEKIKISYTFTSRELFDFFVDLVKDKKVNNDFSVLYYDLNKKDFVEEFKITRYDGTVCKSLLDEITVEDIKVSKKALKVVSGVNDKLAVLSDVERKVVCLASGIFDGKEKSMDDIASELNISVPSAVGIYEAAMKKLAE